MYIFKKKEHTHTWIQIYTCFTRPYLSCPIDSKPVTNFTIQLFMIEYSGFFLDLIIRLQTPWNRSPVHMATAFKLPAISHVPLACHRCSG